MITERLGDLDKKDTQFEDGTCNSITLMSNVNSDNDHIVTNKLVFMSETSGMNPYAITRANSYDSVFIIRDKDNWVKSCVNVDYILSKVKSEKYTDTLTIDIIDDAVSLTQFSIDKLNEQFMYITINRYFTRIDIDYITHSYVNAKENIFNHIQSLGNESLPRLSKKILSMVKVEPKTELKTLKTMLTFDEEVNWLPGSMAGNLRFNAYSIDGYKEFLEVLKDIVKEYGTVDGFNHDAYNSLSGAIKGLIEHETHSPVNHINDMSEYPLQPSCVLTNAVIRELYVDLRPLDVHCHRNIRINLMASKVENGASLLLDMCSERKLYDGVANVDHLHSPAKTNDVICELGNIILSHDTSLKQDDEKTIDIVLTEPHMFDRKTMNVLVTLGEIYEINIKYIISMEDYDLSNWNLVAFKNYTSNLHSILGSACSSLIVVERLEDYVVSRVTNDKHVGSIFNDIRSSEDEFDFRYIVDSLVSLVGPKGK